MLQVRGLHRHRILLLLCNCVTPSLLQVTSGARRSAPTHHFRRLITFAAAAAAHTLLRSTATQPLSLMRHFWNCSAFALEQQSLLLTPCFTLMRRYQREEQGHTQAMPFSAALVPTDHCNPVRHRQINGSPRLNPVALQRVITDVAHTPLPHFD